MSVGRPFSVPMEAPRGFCGRWNRGPPLVRLYNRMRGRRAVYMCRMLPNHWVLKLRADQEYQKEEWVWDWGRLSRKADRVRELQQRAGDVSTIARVGAWKKQKVWHFQRGIEFGHRYEFTRWE